MRLKDKIVKALALHWLKGKIKDPKGTIGSIYKALDGWKLVIGVVISYACSVYDQLNNGNAGNVVGAVLAAIGWAPGAEWTGDVMARAAGSAIALFGIVHKLIKAQKQVRAGATISETLSPEGYVKAAVADGTLKIGD